MKRISLLLLAVACNSGGKGEPTPPPTTTGIQLVEVARGLEQPLYVTAPAGDARLFVVEQTGRIRIIQNGAVVQSNFAD